jgi:hypothetical protein
MAAKITGAALIANGAIGDIHTTARHDFGTVVEGVDAVGGFAEFIYLKGVGSTIVGSPVTYDELGVTALLAANAKGPVAVALAIMDATTKFGWYAITGTHPVDTVANSADNSTVGRETTNGKVGDNRAAGDEINNWVQRAATTAAAVVNHQFNRPFVNDFTGA